MSTPPNVYPHGPNFSYQVVVGGQLSDKCPDESGTCKIIDPLKHSESGYDIEKLPFVTGFHAPDQASAETTYNPCEPGTVVVVSNTTGEPSCRVVVGSFNQKSMLKSDEGNNPVMAWIKKAMALTTDKNRPTKFQEKQERGATVRAIDQEQGDWKNELTKGIPTHAAFSTLAGQILPQVKQIDTAIQKAMNIPSASMLSQLPGSFQSLSSLFSGMSEDQKKEATGNMNEDILMAFESILVLLQDGEVLGNYVTDGRVHTETLTENAIALLKQVTNLSELIGVMDRLRSDTSLHGLDKLESITFTSNTAYGMITRTLDIDGNLTLDANSSNLISAATQALTSSMGSSTAGDPTKSLFGDGAQQMADAFSRLAGQGEEFRNKLVKDVVQKTKQAKHDTVHEYTCGKGNPLSCFISGLGA